MVVKDEWEKMAENAPAFRGQEVVDFVDADGNSVFSSEEEARARIREQFDIPSAEEARRQKKPEEGGTPTPTIE